MMNCILFKLLPEHTVCQVLFDWLSIVDLSALDIALCCDNTIIREHLLKIIALFEKGEEVFGSIDEFNYWLNKPFWNSHETPLGWLNTSGGVDLVTDELDKLSQGYPV